MSGCEGPSIAELCSVASRVARVKLYTYGALINHMNLSTLPSLFIFYSFRLGRWTRSRRIGGGGQFRGTQPPRTLSTSKVCDATSVAVSPSVVVAVGNNALSAVGLMPPCGVRARVYPDPAVLGAGLGENIVSINVVTTNT